MPRKMRIRPTAQQTEALKKFYKHNPHPSKEDREELGDRIGMSVFLSPLLSFPRSSLLNFQALPEYHKLVPESAQSRKEAQRRCRGCGYTD
jgi:hypothetical protein